MPKPSEMLMQTSSDVVRIFEHGAKASCRMLDHGCIALSGEAAADLNMVILAKGGSRDELEEGLRAVRRKAVDAVLLVEEGADEIRSWASEEGLVEVGQVPLMERSAAEVGKAPALSVRLARPDEMKRVSRLAAQAFSLDEKACEGALPGKVLAAGGVDVWVAEEQGELLGCGVFIRSEEHVGIYTMSTPPLHQRRGVGGAILNAAMAHYQADGVARFTLGATEKGFPLYQRVGFEVVSRPQVFVVGASTQFPGH